MKFKVGDKVKIKKDLQVWTRYGTCSFVPGMAMFRGNVVTIKEVHDADYFIDGSTYYWTDEMIEGLVPKFKVGDLIKGTNTRYNYTNNNMLKGKILEVNSNGDLKIEILEHVYSYEVGMKYWALDMKDEYFEVLPKEPNPPFKVGDRLTGIKDNRYGITNEDMTEGVVLSLDNKLMVIKVLSHVSEKWVGDTYTVVNDATRFKKLETKVKEMKFKVGDRITGIKNNGYGVTNEKMTEAVVTELYDNDMRIKIISHVYPAYNGDSFPVDNDSKKFKKLAPKVEPKPVKVVESKLIDTVEITENKIAKYIKVGDITIAVPVGTPIGISAKDPVDTYSAEVGQGVATMRMLGDAVGKGII